MEGVPEAEVIKTMVDSGAGSDTHAADICSAIRAEPSYAAGRWAVQRLQKLESVLAMRQSMRDLSELGSQIERVAGLSSTEFLDFYYSANLPVVLEDVCDEWPARELWDSGYLEDVLGHHQVEFDGDREPMRLADFLQAAWNLDRDSGVLGKATLAFESEEQASAIRGDLEIDDRYLRAGDWSQRTNVTFAPSGTVASLQQAISNRLEANVSGEVFVTLISPLETHCVYNLRSVYSEVDATAPDLAQFPKYGSVRPFQITVGPGEALFVPVGWWYHAEALSPNIAVHCTNFIWPNAVRWSHPDIKHA